MFYFALKENIGSVKMEKIISKKWKIVTREKRLAESLDKDKYGYL
jgi:hypothetical protein